MRVFGSCLFFQAEDGIRDLVRSRGLGDVYKRQPLGLAELAGTPLLMRESGSGTRETLDTALDGYAPVSYTHLTLPTSDLV